MLLLNFKRKTLQQTEAAPDRAPPWRRCISSATPVGPAPPPGCSGDCWAGGRRSSPSLPWWRRARGRNGRADLHGTASDLGHWAAWCGTRRRPDRRSAALVLSLGAESAGCCSPPLLEFWVVWTGIEPVSRACRRTALRSSSRWRCLQGCWACCPSESSGKILAAWRVWESEGRLRSGGAGTGWRASPAAGFGCSLCLLRPLSLGGTIWV